MNKPSNTSTTTTTNVAGFSTSDIHGPPPPYAEYQNASTAVNVLPPNVINCEPPPIFTCGQPSQYPPPPHPGMTTTVIVTTIQSPVFLAPHSVNTQCPHCRAFVLTQTSKVVGNLVWLLCAISLFFGCWLGCCLIPFCINDFRDVEHRCPQCKVLLGVHRRL